MDDMMVTHKRLCFAVRVVRYVREYMYYAARWGPAAQHRHTAHSYTQTVLCRELEQAIRVGLGWQRNSTGGVCVCVVARLVVG